MYIAYARTYPLLKHQKCPCELLRGFLSNFKDYLEEYSLELDLMQLVANLGFPAIVTMYLLVRIEGKLESLSIGINSLNSNISELNNKI